MCANLHPSLRHQKGRPCQKMYHPVAPLAFCTSINHHHANFFATSSSTSSLINTRRPLSFFISYGHHNHRCRTLTKTHCFPTTITVPHVTNIIDNNNENSNNNLSSNDNENENTDVPSSSFPPITTKTSTTATTSTSTLKKQTRRRKLGKKTTLFEATIDNMTMKRMGRGTIYYGDKTIVDSDAPSFLSSSDVEEEELKPDAVLVTGATGATGLWITLGLLNQGFNVRAFTRKFSRAEMIFGPSGTNVDVFEGNASNMNDIDIALDGAIAVVCAASGSPSWFPLATKRVDINGMQNIIESIKQNNQSNMQRIVFISTACNNVSFHRSKRQAEDLLKQAGIPYTIIRVPTLSDTEGGLKNIIMKPITNNDDDQNNSRIEKEEYEGKSISRVDVAQCVCQTLVHHRRILKMAKEDPDAGFEFPNCTFSVVNSEDPFVPDKRFWINAFNRISDAFRPDTEDEPVESVTENVN